MRSTGRSTTRFLTPADFAEDGPSDADAGVRLLIGVFLSAFLGVGVCPPLVFFFLFCVRGTGAMNDLLKGKALIVAEAEAAGGAGGAGGALAGVAAALVSSMP